MATIFLTWQIYYWSTFVWGKTKHKHFWMVKLVASAPKALWLKCWTSSHGQKHFWFIKWFVPLAIILASRRTYHALNCWSFRWLLNTKLKHGLTNDLGSIRMQLLQTSQACQKWTSISTIFIWGSLQPYLLTRWHKPLWQPSLWGMETRHHPPTSGSALAPLAQLAKEVSPSLHQQWSVHSANSTTCQALCLVRNNNNNNKIYL